jgi:hypothetical protein
MPPSISFPIRRLIFASIVATAAGTIACTWSLGYLDDGADAGSSGSSDLSSASSSSSSDPGTGDAGSSSSSSLSSSSSSSSSSAYLGDGGNLIVNPSCADGVLNWTTLSGTPVEESTVFVHAPNDTSSCCAYDRIDPETSGATSGPSYDGPLQDITAVVVAGHSYAVSAWVLWALPGATPQGDAGYVGDAGDASTGSADGAAATGSDASADAGADAGYGPQNVDIAVKSTCGATSTYTHYALATDVPAETWTQVVGTSLITPTAGCDLQLYVEGADMGLNLYVDEVTLTLFQ